MTSCVTVTEVDCNTAVLVSTDTPTVVTTDNPTTVINQESDVSTVVQTDTADIVVQQQDVTTILTECVQGPPGKDGVDGIGVVEVASGPVPNSDTVTADEVLWANVRSVKWIVTITDDLSSEYKTYEVLAVHNDLNALYSVYGIVGAKISVFTDVVLEGAYMRIKITNNSANDIDIKVQRIATTV